MVPGPPPARSVRTTLRLTTSLALRSSKQSIPRDFSSGAWSRKPKRPEAEALTETPAQSGCAFHADSALPRSRARATSPPSAAGARSWRRRRRARDSRPHAEEPRVRGVSKHEDDAAHSVNSPPPCGEGLVVGVRQRITARPPPRPPALRFGGRPSPQGG